MKGAEPQPLPVVPAGVPYEPRPWYTSCFCLGDVCGTDSTLKRWISKWIPRGWRLATTGVERNSKPCGSAVVSWRGATRSCIAGSPISNGVCPPIGRGRQTSRRHRFSSPPGPGSSLTGTEHMP